MHRHKRLLPDKAWRLDNSTIVHNDLSKRLAEGCKRDFAQETKLHYTIP